MVISKTCTRASTSKVRLWQSHCTAPLSFAGLFMTCTKPMYAFCVMFKASGEHAVYETAQLPTRHSWSMQGQTVRPTWMMLQLAARWQPTTRESRASINVIAIPPWLSCPVQLMGLNSSCIKTYHPQYRFFKCMSWSLQHT